MNDLPSPDAVSISDLTLDYVLDHVGTPHVHLLGGKGVYSAVGIWLWGLRVGLAVTAGNDFPAEWLQPFVQAGIDITGIQHNPHYPTARWCMQYAPDGERVPWNPYRHFAEGGVPPPVPLGSLPDLEGISPAAVWRALGVKLDELPPAYWDARGYHFAGAEFTRYPDVVTAWVERGAILTLDADWRPQEMREGRVKRVDCTQILSPIAPFTAVLPSKEDVLNLFGPDTDLRWAARRLAEAGPPYVAIKLGIEGSLLYQRERDEFTHVPIVPTQTVDPTGAGDAYAGGFLAGLLLTNDPLQAACYGTVSASFVVEGIGAAHALGSDRSQAAARLAWLQRQIE